MNIKDICKFRAVKVYLPAKGNIPFFKYFIDMCKHYGFNTVMIELGGAMEYKSHPEINEGWVEYCKMFQAYQGQSIDIQNSKRWAKNSIHCENGGGGWLTRGEIKDIVHYCKEKDIEIIPEVPCLSHSDYLLFRHKELAENRQDDIPDTYCPQNPETYELLFDILNEVIELFKPKAINIGHDELYLIGWCKKCKGKNAVDLYAGDIIKIYNFLREKGVETMMWGDKLLNAYSKTGNDWGGAYRKIYSEKTGEFLHDVPALYETIDRIPKDIIIMHWYWSVREHLENEFTSRRMRTVYGNFNPMSIYNWKERIKKGISGFCISNWSALDKEHMQRNGIFLYMAYSKLMLEDDFDENKFCENFIKASDDIYYYGNANVLCGRHIEITHTTDVFNEHPSFADGFFIDRQKDYLGDYIITYSTGKKVKVPVYYGINIGNENVSFERRPGAEFDNLELSPHLVEPSFTCRYQYEDGKMWYTFCFPTEESVTSVELAKNKNCKGCISIKKIHLKKVSKASISCRRHIFLY